MAMTGADDRARDSINHEMILRYEMDFASMKAWRDKVAATALDDRTISTPLGRRLQVAKAREDIADIVPAGSTSPLGFQHCFTSIVSSWLTSYHIHSIHLVNFDKCSIAQSDEYPSGGSVWFI
jgi:hypothetical protein